MSEQKPGKLFVISAPSGAGKTSLVKALVAGDPNIVFSISYTTRPIRPGEMNGQDYYFVAPEEFAERVAQGEFLEHAQVFDNCYGTHREQIQDQLQHGRNVVLEIDWQGARQVRAAMPDCVSVFVLPTSRAELARRLRGRGTDSAAIIDRRLRDAQADMSHWHEFDYVIINDTFEHALAAMNAIITGAGNDCAVSNPDLRLLVNELLAVD
ncbi:MAG TPA: guanylate kinase [Gammaproteobacteria bacterium]|nr:guanylate kinase [Gammaproteobacteria bacterium]